jgi:hypothetical protein
MRRLFVDMHHLRRLETVEARGGGVAVGAAACCRRQPWNLFTGSAGRVQSPLYALPVEADGDWW